MNLPDSLKMPVGKHARVAVGKNGLSARGWMQAWVLKKPLNPCAADEAEDADTVMRQAVPPHTNTPRPKQMVGRAYSCSLVALQGYPTYKKMHPPS